MHLGPIIKVSGSVSLPVGMRASEREEWVSARQRLYNTSVTVIRGVRTFFQDVSGPESPDTEESLKEAYDELAKENKTLIQDNRILRKSNKAYASAYVPTLPASDLVDN